MNTNDWEEHTRRSLGVFPGRRHHIVVSNRHRTGSGNGDAETIRVERAGTLERAATQAGHRGATRWGRGKPRHL